MQARPLLSFPLVMLVTLGVAAAAVPAGAQDAVPFTTVATGRGPSVPETLRIVVRDAKTWQAMWTDRVGLSGGPQPTVNFHSEMVVGVFAGATSGAGRVTIVGMQMDAGTLTVSYAYGDRPLIDGPPDALMPFHIVTTGYTVSPVRFVRVRPFRRSSGRSAGLDGRAPIRSH